jgi:dihydrodipicolinate synthase/N-acetylneuraminate lyase
MSKPLIEGSFVALITPFNRDGTVDFEGFRTLLDFQRILLITKPCLVPVVGD